MGIIANSTHNIEIVSACRNRMAAYPALSMQFAASAAWAQYLAGRTLY
jgi:hypothetical protein